MACAEDDHVNIDFRLAFQTNQETFLVVIINQERELLVFKAKVALFVASGIFLDHSVAHDDQDARTLLDDVIERLEV